MDFSKVKLKITLSLLLAISTIIPSIAQSNWGLGLRLGEPAAISAKKYMGSNALEINVGTARWFNGYSYGNGFTDWYNKQSFNYTDFQYLDYKSSAPLTVQVHYLFHRDITKLGDESISGLDWYYGFGGQMRYNSYRYDYRYKVIGDPNWRYANGNRVTDIDLGLDGVIGLEYTFDDIPVSVFIDATLFLELVDDPLNPWFQGGLGARYNF